MAGFERSIVIDRPIAEVFDFACDLGNVRLFMPNVTKTETYYRDADTYAIVGVDRD